MSSGTMGYSIVNTEWIGSTFLPMMAIQDIRGCWDIFGQGVKSQSIATPGFCRSIDDSKVCEFHTWSWTTSS
jgi:hypothetical protein